MPPLGHSPPKSASDVFSDRSSSSSPTLSSTQDHRKVMIPPLGPRSSTGSSSSPAAASPANSPRPTRGSKSQQMLCVRTSPPPSPRAPSSSSSSGDGSVVDDTISKLELAVQTNLAQHQQQHQLHRQQHSNRTAAASLYNQLGNAHFRRGNVDAAQIAYERAMEAADESGGPHLVSALSNLATCHWKTHNCAQAIQLLEQALRVLESDLQQQQNSNNSNLNDNLQAASIYHQLGVCYCLEKEFPKALERLAAALQIRERHHVDVAPTLDAMGKVYLLQSNLNEALQCHQRAWQMAERVTTCLPLARVHHAAGRTRDAIAWLERAVIALSPQDGTTAPALPATLEFLVQLLEETGDAEAAAKYRAQLP